MVSARWSAGGISDSSYDQSIPSLTEIVIVTDESVETTDTEAGQAKFGVLPLAALAAACGMIAIAYFQSSATEDDHQNANIMTLVIGLATSATVLLLLQWAAVRTGRFWQVPIATLAAVILFAVVFEYDGFSGEIVPQFKYRFASEPPLQTLDSATGVEVDRSITEPPTNSESRGLLGNDRNGRVSERQFSIPSDTADVEVVWSQGVGQGWSSFAVANGRAVTLEQRDDLECVTCYNLADGELIWNVNHQARHDNAFGGTGPRSTPTIDDDRVYAQGATGHVWCIDLNSGEVRWEIDLLQHAGWDQTTSEDKLTWGRSGSPLVVDDLCVVPYGGPDDLEESGRTLIALAKRSGEVRWTAGSGQPSYASPDVVELAETRQIVSVNESTITGHAVSDSKVLWDFTWPGGSNGAANCAKIVPAGKDQFIIGKGYGGGSALVKITKAKDGTLSADSVWESTRVLKTKFTHAVVAGDVAYGISNGSLEAVMIADGQRLWMQPRRSRFGQGQMLIVDDTIVAQSESGDVALAQVNPEEYQELVRIDALSAKTWNIPTIAGRYLIVRNDRQAICFRLPAKS